MPTGRLRDLSLDDFAVALAGDRVLGVIACWNQQSFRQHVVAGYHGMPGWVRAAVNLASSCFDCRLLPPPGESVNHVLAACIAIRHDDAQVFRALLRHLQALHADRGHTFLSIGLAEHDPLLPLVRDPLHLTLRSRIYAIEWDDGHADFEVPDDRARVLGVGKLMTTFLPLPTGVQNCSSNCRSLPIANRHIEFFHYPFLCSLFSFLAIWDSL